MRQGTARSASGTLSVVTTERGLPTAVRIDARELKRAPQQLADEIVALCRLSAMRAQVAHRRELVEQGMEVGVLAALKLATEEELAGAEDEITGDEDLPDSWMRSV